jgi:hypothetical protein
LHRKPFSLSREAPQPIFCTRRSVSYLANRAASKPFPSKFQRPQI